MTCKEKFEIEHPDDVYSYYCPDEYGYAREPKYCNPFVWSEECERCWDREIKEEKEKRKMKKEFTKADLKTGMVAELRNGDKMFVIKSENNFRLLNDQYLKGEHYNDALITKNRNDKKYDIVAIFLPDVDKVYTVRELYSKLGNEIWRRRKTLMTIKEIEEKLGFEIEIVEEK